MSLTVPVLGLSLVLDQKYIGDFNPQAAFGLNLNTIEDADEQFTKAADTILGGIKFKINNPLHKVSRLTA